MKILEGRRILIGITGGIASYKVANLVRSIKRSGGLVRVIMTPFATRFISPLTFETLSGEKVYVEWEEDPLAHITLSRWAETFLIAPCTVNTLSKIANAQGDNLLTTTALAYTGPLLIAPAANTLMLSQKAVKRNMDLLVKERSAVIIKPDYGVLACEEEGEGKLADEERLLDWLAWSLFPKPLKGRKVLITAGATREYIDPVRYISNESSGRMGFSLARVARWFGAEVTVIAGYTTAPEPPEVGVIRAQSASEMLSRVLELFTDSDVLIMSAAVSDFSVKERVTSKIKKGNGLVLELVPSRDILSEVSPLKKSNQVVVGFALETEELLKNAREKLKRKNLSFVVANDVSSMGSESHRGYLVFPDREVSFDFSDKIQSALLIIEEVIRLLKS
jgi:phosphopantothenoylcysteine decarboxylase/phosphopantothenate--cysteine ligase